MEILLEYREPLEQDESLEIKKVFYCTLMLEADLS